MAKYVVLDQQQINTLLAGPSGPVYSDLRRRGNRVMNQARRLCPADTGRLRQSISLEMGAVGDRVVARIGTNVQYGLFIHEGTANNGTGYIYPKNAKVLRFPVVNKSGAGRRRYKGGATAQYAYAKRVRGIKATPFLRDALQAAADN